MLVNQFLPISLPVLAFFQNLNSSIEADIFPQPSVGRTAPPTFVPDTGALSAPMLATSVPVTSFREPDLTPPSEGILPAAEGPP